MGGWGGDPDLTKCELEKHLNAIVKQNVQQRQLRHAFQHQTYATRVNRGAVLYFYWTDFFLSLITVTECWRHK